MKIKLLKTLAVVFAVCLTFAGISALAADVVIETSYDYADVDTPVIVNAKVQNIDADAEVTYYVSDNEGNVVYLNQETANGSGVVTFPAFKAGWNTLLASTVKFGSDASWSESGFTFVNGGNYKTSGSAWAEADDAWAVEGSFEDEDGLVEGISYTAKVGGNYSEYGIKVTIGGTQVKLPALGCSEDGTYTVLVGGVVLTDIQAAEAYAE